MPMMNEAVQTIMTKDLITLHSSDKVSEVTKIFRNNRIHHLPIVEGEKLVGLITTYDLWKMGKSFEESKNITIGEVMSKKLAVLGPNDKIGTAAEILLFNRFHALPIVENGKLLGIITTHDVLKYEFKKEYPKTIMHKDLFEGERAR